MSEGYLIPGRFKVLGELGRGATSRVYRVLGPAEGTELALKTFARRIAPSEAARECARLVGVDFPGIARIRSCGLDGQGLFFFTTDLVDGADLVEVGRSCSSAQLLELVAHLLRALGFVHEQGLVHGDVKPANVLVESPSGPRRWDEVCPLSLIDFGLATRSGAHGCVGGTPRYMAPEVLAGGMAPASDLFSLGVVLAEILVPDSTGATDRLVGPALDRLLGNLAKRQEPVARLAVALLAEQPGLRPVTARDAMIELARLTPQAIPLETPATRAGRVLSVPPQPIDSTVSRAHLEGPETRVVLVEWSIERERDRLVAALACRVASRGITTLFIRTSGPGLRFRDPCRVAMAGINDLIGEPSTWLAPTDEAEHAKELVRLLHRASDRRPFVVFFEGLDADVEPWLPVMEATLGAGIRVVVVPASAGSSDRIASRLGDGGVVERVAEAPMVPQDCHAWLERVLGCRPTDELTAFLGCHQPQPPALVQEALAHALNAGLVRFGPSRASISQTAGRSGTAVPSLGGFYSGIIATLSEEECGVLRLLALSRGPLDEGRLTSPSSHSSETMAPAEILSSLTRARLIRRGVRGGKHVVSLTSGLLAAMIERDIPEPEQQRIHALLADWARSGGGTDEEIGWHLARAGRPGEALSLLLGAARRRLERFELEVGRELLDEAWRTARSCGDDSAAGEVQELRAEAFVLAGESRRAERLLRESLDDLCDGRVRARLLIALGRCLEKVGDYDASLSRLGEALESPGITPEDRAKAQVGRALVLYRKGDYDTAARICRDLSVDLPDRPSHTRLRAVNLLGLIAEEQGLHEEAGIHMARAVEEAEAIGRPSMQASLLMNAARCDRACGQIGVALAKLEKAGALFAAQGEKHYHTIVHCNSAYYHFVEGDLNAVKESLQKVGECLAERPDASLEALYDHHLGVLALAEGELGEAERRLARSAAVRERLEEQAGLVETLVVWSRLALRRGDGEVCGQLLDRAEQALEGLSSRSLWLDCSLARLERALVEGERDAVAAMLDEVERGLVPLDRLRRATALIALARAALVIGRQDRAIALAGEGRRLSDGMDVRALLGLHQVLELLAGPTDRLRADRLERAFSMVSAGWYDEDRAWLLVRAVHQGLVVLEPTVERGPRGVIDGVDLARLHDWAERAVNLYDRLGHAVGRAEAETLQAEIVALAQRRGGGDVAARRLQWLERVRHVVKAINDETDDESLLRKIMDTAVDLVGARRGFLILAKNDRLEIRVARNIGDRDIHNPQFEISHTVAGRVARSGQPLLISNAAGDPDWGSTSSVSHLQLLSILCVPLRVRGETIGSLYVDDPTSVGRFGSWHLEMLADFSDHAAVALQKSRLIRENIDRARELSASKREIERLAEKLRHQVDQQARELIEVKTTLRRTREQAGLKYDYSSIITHAPAMRQVLAQLDKITDLPFPVLIRGESGTGKELVARALHVNGSRGDRQLHSLNCAAFSEALVEAELFGYRQGAFTGAVADRAGIFEVADGSTLLLDEIGDMSLEVQKRLLRVLQSGDYYRLGDHEPRRSDVRILAATHRDLRELVSKGLFREDLFFRLNVLRIELPALRERPEDIPLLFDHFQRMICDELEREPLVVTRRAMDALVLYSWPGNVRELENETRNLVCLAGAGKPLDLEDLPERVRAAAPTAGEAVAGDGGGDGHWRPLREELADVERQAVLRALHATGGNKSAAARLLGMTPRNLFKKLQRLGIG